MRVPAQILAGLTAQDPDRMWRVLALCVKLFLGRTSRIRRRRAQDVADTTNSHRAVACIRFVRRCVALWISWHGRVRV